MTDLEDLVRATLGERAEDAPAPHGLPEAVRARRHRSRRTRQTAAVLAVAAATAAAVVIPLTLTGAPSAGEKHVTTPAPQPSHEQLIGFHGIEITVPASWKLNDARCGTPVADTVLRDEGGVLTCLAPRPAGISSIELLTTSKAWEAAMTHVVTVTNAHGVSLRRGRMPGRPVVVLVPATGVLAFVDTPSPTLTDRLINSIEVTTTDSTGCKMREFQLRPPFAESALRGPYQRYVIEPGPATIAICHYEDNWLVSSLVVSGSAAARIVAAANTAPNGYVHAPPQKGVFNPCTAPLRMGGERGTGFILWARYANGYWRQLWFHMGSCGALGITNGQRAGALTLELARAINEPLHRGFGIPGHLLPGPG